MGRRPQPVPTETRFRLEPSPEVMAYFRNKGMQPSVDWRDVYPQEHAHAFTVAKATQLAVLRAIQQEVERALTEGLPFETFAAELTPRLQRLGWWGKQPVTDPVTGEQVLAQLGSPHRLRIIFDANIRTANAAGQWQRIWRTRAVLPFLIYQHTTSQEPREEHWEWAEQPIVLPVEDAWWHTHFPPNGWQCKCWVLQGDEDDARAAGWRPGTEAPDLDMVEWFNARTGETELVPAGIDPGWATNPGLTRQQLLDGLLNNALEDATPAVREVALKDLTDGWLFRQIASGKVTSKPNQVRRNPLVPEIVDTLRGKFANADVVAPAAHVSEALQTKLGWRSGVVWLDPEGAETVRKAAGRTAAAQASVDWSLVPRVIDGGAAIQHRITRDWVTFYREIDGEWYRAEVMRRELTTDGYQIAGGGRLRLESFARISAQTAKVEMQAGITELLRGEAPKPRFGRSKEAPPAIPPAKAPEKAPETPPRGPKDGLEAPKAPPAGKPLPSRPVPFLDRLDGPPRPEAEAIAAARNLVVSQGKLTGCEWGCLVGPEGQHLVTWSAGKPSFLDISQKAQPELYSARKVYVVHHNHPSSTSLSVADLRMLDKLPGLASVYAHGHDGSVYRAALAAAGEVSAKLVVIDAVAMDAVREARRLGLLSAMDADRLYGHIRNTSLGRLGIIKYEAELGAANQPLIERNAATVEALVNRIVNDVKETGLDR